MNLERPNILADPSFLGEGYAPSQPLNQSSHGFMLPPKEFDFKAYKEQQKDYIKKKLQL
jgi:hypothetical protein